MTNSKKSTNETKVSKTTNHKLKIQNGVRGIIGLLLALSVISIVYTSVVVFMGTEGILPKIMIVPQAILALTIIVWKFCK